MSKWELKGTVMQIEKALILYICYYRICMTVPLITHFVWYLEKEKGYDIETLSIDRVLNGDIFMQNHVENMHRNLVSGPFLNLVNNLKQPLYARNCFKNKIFWKRIIKKSYKS